MVGRKALVKEKGTAVPFFIALKYKTQLRMLVFHMPESKNLSQSLDFVGLRRIEHLNLRIIRGD